MLLGAAGVNVTNDRQQGFEEQMAAKASKMKVIAKQAADYERAKGQTVTAQLIQANPEINCIYAHNDEMALGAVAALKDAGKQPGDVKILTIDGTQGAVQGIVDGWISGVIESNPRFGPLAFKALEDFYGGVRRARRRPSSRTRSTRRTTPSPNCRTRIDPRTLPDPPARLGSSWVDAGRARVSCVTIVQT